MVTLISGILILFLPLQVGLNNHIIGKTGGTTIYYRQSQSDSTNNNNEYVLWFDNPGGKTEFHLFEPDNETMVIENDSTFVYSWRGDEVEVRYKFGLYDGLYVKVTRGNNIKDYYLPTELLRSCIIDGDTAFFDRCTYRRGRLWMINEDVIILNYLHLVYDSDVGYYFIILIEKSQFRILNYEPVFDDLSSN